MRVADEQCLGRYRFALRTADFFICRTCGAYLGAVLSVDGGVWSTVNLRLTGLSVTEVVASYDGEDAGKRIERRKRNWTPTTVFVDAQGR